MTNSTDHPMRQSIARKNNSLEVIIIYGNLRQRKKKHNFLIFFDFLFLQLVHFRFRYKLMYSRKMIKNKVFKRKVKKIIWNSCRCVLTALMLGLKLVFLFLIKTFVLNSVQATWECPRLVAQLGSFEFSKIIKLN